MVSLVERFFGKVREYAERENGPDMLVREKSERFARIVKCWAYYLGNDPGSGKSQWTYLRERFADMPLREIEDTENHTRICADRLRRLLVNSFRGFDFSDREAGRKIQEVFDSNDWLRLMNRAVLYGQVTGDSFIKVAPQPENSRYGRARLILLDTEGVELEVSPHDRDDVRAVRVSYDFYDLSRRNHGEGGGATVRKNYLEIIDSQSVRAFVDGKVSKEFSYEHNLGFIPVVHIRYRDTPGGIYGESLVERLTMVQDSINLLASDLMDMVRFDGHKTTVFQNVNIDKAASRDGATSGEIDLSIGKGLVVKGDGKVYKLEQQQNLGAALEEYEIKLDSFYDLAGVPRFSRDMISSLGNLSGRAIERLYQDAVESTRESQVQYGQSFRELAVKIAAVAGIEPCDIEVLWNNDVIAADVDSAMKEYEAGARSLKSLMRKIGIQDVEKMMEEIREERSALTPAPSPINGRGEII